MRLAWPVALGVAALLLGAGPAYSQCDCCPSSQVSFTARVGAAVCGDVKRNDGSVFTTLFCGGLSFGGGNQSFPLPVQLSDTWQWITNVTGCSSLTGVMTLGPTTVAQVGNRKCTQTGCLFGPPTPVPNAGSTPTSFCLINTLAGDAAGTAQCNDGSASLSLPVNAEIFLDGDLLPGTPGIQPCPICTGPSGSETCQGGPNDTLPCTPANSALGAAFPTSHDCPPPPGNDIGGVSFPFALTSGQVSYTAVPGTGGSTQNRVFCGYCRDADTTGNFESPAAKCLENGASLLPCSQPNEACEQRSQGAFGPAGGLAKTITETGSPAGVCIADEASHNATVVTVYCVPPTFSATVDAALDLPGPGAAAFPVSVAVTLIDTDADTVPDVVDNCPTLTNPGQSDSDAGGLGDTCDPCPQDAANQCRHLSGAGPDPSDPANKSLLAGINDITGGAPAPSVAARSAREVTRGAHALQSTAPTEEVIPFPNVTALACDRQGTLFAGLGPNGGGLVIGRNLNTGTWTTVGPSGQSGFPGGVQGLATSLGGTMYASVVSGVVTSPCSGGADRLATVDKTGTSSPLATVLGAPYGSGITNMNGLSVNPFTGTLYGVTGNCSGGLAPALYTIATSGPSTGVATRIGFLLNGGNPPAQSPSDLAFARDGTLYASLGGSTGTIVRVNPTNATFTVVGPTGLSAATEALTFCPILDQFVTYKSKQTAGGIKFVATTASMTDGLGGTVTVELKKPASTVQPAAAQDADVENPAVPLTGYQIKAAKGVYPTDIHVVNAVGEIVVNLIKPDRLLVRKSISVPTNFVDNYMCYKVKGKLPLGTPARTLDDGFDPARSFALLKPTHLCAPADTGQGFRNPTAYLMCYKVKLPTGQPKHQPQTGIAVADQFSTTAQLDTIKEDELCVPSLLGAAGG